MSIRRVIPRWFVQQATQLVEKRPSAAADDSVQLLSHLSHELRTPLNGVLGILELLLAEEDRPEHIDKLQAAKDNAQSVVDSLDDLYEWADLRLGTPRVGRSEAVRFKAAVDVWFEGAVGTARLRSLDLKHVYDSPGPEVVNLSGREVQRLLDTMVGQTLRLAPSSGKVDVSMGWRPTEGSSFRLKIEVKTVWDDLAEAGDGLYVLGELLEGRETSRGKAYPLNHLWVHWFRAWLGAHDGEFGLLPAVHHGSEQSYVVRAEFNVEECAATEAEPIQGKHGEPSSLPSGLADEYPASVLIVEDNPLNELVLRRMLEKMGYRPDSAVDGLEAVKATERNPFDLILMDVHLPKMDGVEATERIRRSKDKKHRPSIVAVTSSALNTDRIRCVRAGMDGFVNKPVPVEELVRLLKAFSPRRKGGWNRVS